MTIPRPQRTAHASMVPSPPDFPGARRLNPAEGESGATLILALIFIVVISVIVASLTTWVSNDLNNTGKFDAALQFESTANSGVEVALQNVRFNFATQTLNAVPPQPCWTTSPSVSQVTFNSQTVSVWCTTSWSPVSANTRLVTLYVCRSNFVGTPTLAAMNVASTACAVNPLLQSVIAFDDYPNTISAANCFGVFPPNVSGVVDAVSASCTSPSKLVTITGTSLTGATAVNFFVPQASNNAIFSASPLSGGSATSVKVCGPSGLSTGSTYQVTVTTPNGTSVPSAVGESALTY
jgi:hypothetical protein